MPGIFFGVKFQAHVFFWIRNMKLCRIPVMNTASTPLGLVDFTLNLPEGQVKVLGKIFLEKIRASWKNELLFTLLLKPKYM